MKTNEECQVYNDDTSQTVTMTEHSQVNNNNITSCSANTHKMAAQTTIISAAAGMPLHINKSQISFNSISKPSYI